MGQIDGSFGHLLGEHLNLDTVTEVNVVVVVEVQDVLQGVLRVLQSHANLVQVELLDALEEVTNHFCALRCQLPTGTRLDWHDRCKVAQVFVRCERDGVLFEQSLEDGAAVDGLENHFHVVRVSSLAEGPSGEVV